MISLAPGRVNLIGEHTDYNSGFALPMAIERHTAIAARPLGDQGPRVARVYSMGLDRAATFSIEPGDLVAGVLGAGVLGAAIPERPSGPDWSSYVRGVVAGCGARGWKLPSFEAVVGGTVPLGGGLSSSASLEVAMLLVLESLAGERLSDLDRALVCQKAEHDFAGVPCGLMDQFVSVHAQADSLLLLDCRSLEATPTPLDDPAMTVMIADSRVKHQLAGDGRAYASRRADCEAASLALGTASLRDASLADLEHARPRLDDVLYRRARHVMTENARTLAAAAALEAHDWSAVGAAMAGSHASLRFDFEVSCRELDLLVEFANDLGPEQGVFGARMTGGGFGGCTVNLVRADAAEHVARSIAAHYESATGLHAEFFCSRPAAGARLIEPRASMA